VILTRTLESNGIEAMSFDAVMLRDAEQGQCSWRTYTWDSIWVTLGYRQHPETALVRPDLTAYAMRPTGGLAVIHGHDLTFSFAMPLAAITADGRRLREVYQVLTAPLVTALGEAGVPVSRGKAEAKDRSEDCFSSAGEYDLVTESGSKVCGCAMRVTRTAALLQASLPLRPPAVDPRETIVGGVPFIGPSLDEARLIRSLELQLREVPVANRSL
jgi:lipoate-protein ligase A